MFNRELRLQRVDTEILKCNRAEYGKEILATVSQQ
jgi:hypothetical protein